MGSVTVLQAGSLTTQQVLALGAVAAVVVIYVLTDTEDIGQLWHLLGTSRVETGRVELGETRDTATVHGHAAALSEPIETPFSERMAFAAEWEVYDLERHGRRTIRRDVKEGREVVPFVVDDGSGPVLIDPTDAHLLLSTEEMPLDYGGHERRYEEDYLARGDWAVASGAVVPTADLDHEWPRVEDEKIPEHAVISTDDQQMLLADTGRLGLAYRLPRWHLKLTAATLLAVVLVLVALPI